MWNINLKVWIVFIFILMNNSVKQRLHFGAVSSKKHFIFYFGNLLTLLVTLYWNFGLREALVWQIPLRRLPLPISLYKMSVYIIHLKIFIFSFDVDNGASPNRFPLDGSSTGQLWLKHFIPCTLIILTLKGVLLHIHIFEGKFQM